MPNPALSDFSYDFAIFIAGKNDAALVGVNLSAYSLETEHPLVRQVYSETFRILTTQINELCQRDEVKTGFDLLDGIVSSAGMSSFWYRPIEGIQSSDETVQLGLKLFAEKIGRQISSARDPQRQRRRINDRWCEAPSQSFEIEEKHLELTPCEV